MDDMPRACTRCGRTMGEADEGYELCFVCATEVAKAADDADDEAGPSAAPETHAKARAPRLRKTIVVAIVVGLIFGVIGWQLPTVLEMF